MARMSFEQWLQQVDRILVARIGLSYNDLPDCCYADWYEAGVSPKGAASRALRNAGE